MLLLSGLDPRVDGGTMPADPQGEAATNMGVRVAGDVDVRPGALT